LDPRAVEPPPPPLNFLQFLAKYLREWLPEPLGFILPRFGHGTDLMDKGGGRRSPNKFFCRQEAISPVGPPHPSRGGLINILESSKSQKICLGIVRNPLTAGRGPIPEEIGGKAREPGPALNARGAVVLGDVHFGRDASIWYNAVARGDAERVE